MAEIKKGNYYLHNQSGEYMHVNKRTLKSAIECAKKYEFPIQISQLEDNKIYRLKYAHIPENYDFKGANQMSSMLYNNIIPNSI